MRKIIFVLTTSVFLSASCNKEKYPKYYFECKLDGKEYVPDICANCRTAKLLGDTILLVQGSRGIETISLFSSDKIISARSYTLNHERTKHDALYANTFGNTSDIFRTDSLRTGQLTITSLDKINKVVTGSFYFEAYNSFQSKAIKITNGRFRLQYSVN